MQSGGVKTDTFKHFICTIYKIVVLLQPQKKSVLGITYSI